MWVGSTADTTSIMTTIMKARITMETAVTAMEGVVEMAMVEETDPKFAANYLARLSLESSLV